MLNVDYEWLRRNQYWGVVKTGIAQKSFISVTDKPPGHCNSKSLVLKHKGKAIEKQQALECFRGIDSFFLCTGHILTTLQIVFKCNTCQQYHTRFMPTYFKYAAKLQILLIQDSTAGKEIPKILFWEYHSKDYQARQHLLLFCRKDWKAPKESFLNLEEIKI